jgi:macrophage erythroblast attacher
VPYAHHTKSIVEDDPVVLPNGRIYGSERLKAFNKKVGTESGWVRDPVGGIHGDAWREVEVRKVYIM